MPNTAPTQDQTLAQAINHLEPMQQASSLLLNALQGPELIGKLQALQHRLENGLTSLEDRSLLDRLPNCHLTPHELVSTFVRMEQSIPQRLRAQGSPTFEPSARA